MMKSRIDPGNEANAAKAEALCAAGQTAFSRDESTAKQTTYNSHLACISSASNMQSRLESKVIDLH